MAGQDPPLVPASATQKFPHRDRATAFDGGDGETVVVDGTEVAGESVQIGTARQASQRVTTVAAQASVEESWTLDLSDAETLQFDWTSTLNSYYIDVIVNGSYVVGGSGDFDGINEDNGTASYTLDATSYGAGTDIVVRFKSNRSTESQDITTTLTKEDLLEALVAIEWSMPADVFAWGHASFQASPGNGGVVVDVQETADGGSTWSDVSTDITRGADISAADAGNNVRLLVTLSRPATTDNPTLDFVARSYTQ